MVTHFQVSRILGLLAAIICLSVTLAIAAQVAPGKQDDAPDTSGVIILDVSVHDAASASQGQFPPVAFDHNLHTQNDKNGETCATCHSPSGAATSRAFAPADGKEPGDLKDAYHDGCVSCHVTTKNAGKPSGPVQAECRSCHTPTPLPAGKDADTRTDGGLDAGLHARHIASPLLAVPDKDENCSTCHHPVKKPVSPGSTTDSCRSCHLAAKPDGGAPKQSPFADVAHTSCISCHQALAPRGANVALTCNACHDAKTKAGYTRPSPVPRLDAGQPDSLVLELSSPGAAFLPPPSPQGKLPDRDLEAATAPKPTMPPVVFDHQNHEAATDNCTTCHHNTLRKCSDCHTPLGSPAGKNVPQATAMHMPTSPRSCVGCHETRKTATPACASCHGAMPVKPNEPNCASCHKPLPQSGLSPAAPRMPKLTPPQMPGGVSPDMVASRTVPPPDIASAPEKVVIGTLSDKYEPSVMPHRAIVEKLASGIAESSPGMLWFHSSPNALCASCHHNSPPSATPPTCASCHAKTVRATDPPDGRPSLKSAYHQQCMGCHTRIDLPRPVNTDCAGCHALRSSRGAPSAKPEGGK